MEDRFFLKINKYALNYLKNILPEYNVECDKCGTREYDIGKIYHILSNKYEEAFMHEGIASDNGEDADGGDVYLTDAGDIMIKLYKNIYFYTDDNCSCLKVKGFIEQPANK